MDDFDLHVFKRYVDKSLEESCPKSSEGFRLHCFAFHLLEDGIKNPKSDIGLGNTSHEQKRIAFVPSSWTISFKDLS